MQSLATVKTKFLVAAVPDLQETQSVVTSSEPLGVQIA
jgi:hypothetical protein